MRHQERIKCPNCEYGNAELIRDSDNRYECYTCGCLFDGPGKVEQVMRGISLLHVFTDFTDYLTSAVIIFMLFFLLYCFFMLVIVL